MELYIAWLGSIKLKSRIQGQIVFCLTPNIDSTPDYCTVDTGALHYYLSLREKEGGGGELSTWHVVEYRFSTSSVNRRLLPTNYKGG